MSEADDGSPKVVSVAGRAFGRSSGRAVLTQVISAKTPDDILNAFERHAALIGHIVFAWNRLQERLFDLFSIFAEAGDARVPHAIWRSLASDRLQRRILRETAILALEKYQRPDGIMNPTPGEDINWLLDQADNLSGDRNEAIHAPYLFEIQAGATIVVPDQRAANRLRGLSDDALAKEFETFRNEITALWRYAEILATIIRTPRGQPAQPWPERPLLRASARPPTRKGKRRRRGAK